MLCVVLRFNLLSLIFVFFQALCELTKRGGFFFPASQYIFSSSECARPPFGPMKEIISFAKIAINLSQSCVGMCLRFPPGPRCVLVRSHSSHIWPWRWALLITHFYSPALTDALRECLFIIFFFSHTKKLWLWNHQKRFRHSFHVTGSECVFDSCWWHYHSL